MADTTILTNLTNGVSYGYTRTVTAADLTKAGITFNFQASFPLAAHIQYLSDAGVVTLLTNGAISYPANGKVRVFDPVKNAVFAATAELRSIYTVHIADAVEHTGASAPDTTNVLTALPVTTLAEVYAALGELAVAYDAHDDDVDEVTPIYHVATTTTDQLITSVSPTTVAQAVTMINDIISKYTLHDADATSHVTGGTHVPVSTAISGTEFVFTLNYIIKVAAQRARIV